VVGLRRDRGDYPPAELGGLDHRPHTIPEFMMFGDFSRRVLFSVLSI
jgi:hypothetical protein